MRWLTRSVAGSAGLAIMAALAAPAGGNGIYYQSLEGVSCAGESFCIAVGDLAAVWKGHTWRASSLPSGLQLDSVSCSSPSNCVAVGTSSAGGAAADRWNGSDLRKLATPHGTWLDAVSCPTPAWCMAVGGSRAKAGMIRSVAETWSGGRWRTLVVPGEPQAPLNQLRRLSCASETVCVALDEYDRSSTGLRASQTAALEWNGEAWKVLRGSHPLVDVSCLHGVALAGCTYLSFFETSPGRVSLATLAQRASGWTRLGDVRGSAPIRANPSPFAYTCSSASSCMTVGYTTHPARTQSAYIQTYAAQWNGARWSTTRTPSPPPPSVEGGSSMLNAVSCPAPNECTAVGLATFTPLIESWNGRQWTEQPLR